MALVIVRLPAGLVDYGVRHLTDGQLRVVQTQGSVWRGQGVLASSEVSPRLTAARQVAWRTELELYRLAVRLRLSEHGREQLVLTVAPTGLAIEKLGLDLPASLVSAAIRHPAARAGWRGRFLVDSSGLVCDAHAVCAGKMTMEWHDAGVNLLPGHQLGTHRAVLAAMGRSFDVAVNTLDGNVRVDGGGKITDGRLVALDLLFSGPPELVGRLPNVMDGHARLTGEPGQVRLRLP
ncbi:type II secretion system protein N [Thauera sp. CAU 1555]|uniref:Type II secretion system protein N n=1 Tax=Thauera sedimentorum TaxID=2767595 RepID=A0ABR9B8U5_9RHOO|nr:type II secretion system protein N [Thauera sedimentorum]MBC9071682.1 type II secretion system protein N [Thauera sedimentorum]MBD8502601.1 type II secretion system protein N [Thauera sedimentorum]